MTDMCCKVSEGGRALLKWTRRRERAYLATRLMDWSSSVIVTRNPEVSASTASVAVYRRAETRRKRSAGCGV
jgi:hypothetical protein